MSFQDLDNKIIDEEIEKEELKKINNELDTLLDLQKDINTLIYKQDQVIDNISQNIQTTNNNVEIRKEDIKKSHRIYWKLAGPVSAGILGGVVAGPVGFYAGLKGAMLVGTAAGTGLVT